MSLFLDPSYGFNCSALLRDHLSAPLQSLCAVHTDVSLALTRTLFGSCLITDGMCQLGSLVVAVKRARARLLRRSVVVSKAVAEDLRRVVALSGRQTWQESRCSHHLYLWRWERYTHVPAANLLDCMKGFREASWSRWQLLVHYDVLQHLGPRPYWRYERRMHGGQAGEISTDHTHRSFVIYKLLELQGLEVQRMAEIGVQWASTSQTLLKKLPQLHLTLVEPWILPRARRDLEPFAQRVRWIHAKSHVASASVHDESLDLIFIDGDHSYEAVALDLLKWHPKVRRGGTLAGHDFTLLDVARAVRSFALQWNATLRTSMDCWWFQKQNGTWL